MKKKPKRKEVRPAVQLAREAADQLRDALTAANVKVGNYMEVLEAFHYELESLVDEWRSDICELTAEDDEEIDLDEDRITQLSNLDRPLTADELAELSHAEWENDKKNR